MDEFPRPSSDQLTDLHLYVIPPDHWRAHLHSAVNQIINEAVSAGFIRVHPETNIYQLRDELEHQLGYEILPQQYVFLKSVGRCLTRVRPKQEYQLKVKNFLPPSLPDESPNTKAFAPEIFVLEATPEVRSIPFSGTSSQSSDALHNLPSRQFHREPTPRSDRSEFTGHKPIPPIRNTVAIQTSEAFDVPLRAAANDRTRRHSDTGYPHDPYTPRDTQAYGRPRSRSPPPPQPRPRKQEPPETLVIHDGPVRHIATQYSRPPTPYHDDRRQAGPPPPHRDHAPDPSDSRYERVHSPLGHHHGDPGPYHETPRKSTNDTKHVAFEDTAPVVQATPDSGPNSNHPSYRSNYDPYQGQGHGEHGRGGGEGEEGGEYLPPLSASPPQSAEGRDRTSQYHYRTHGGHPAEPRQQPHHHANYSGEESGISDGSELLPEEQQRVDELMRQEDEADEQRRQRLLEDSEGQELPREEVERRQRAQSLLEEEVRRRQQDDNRKQAMEAAEPLPRPDQHPDGSSEDGRGPSSQSQESPDMTALREELRLAKSQRQDMERHREELVKKAKLLQNKTQQKRNQARDHWKKKYFEEKKQTSQTEEQRNKLKHEVEALHRKIMSQLEGAKDPAKRIGDSKPSQQSNLKIQATRLDHDIEDLQRRVENVQMKLTTEMKLRGQAEGELKALRAELTQKKISMALAKGQGHRPQQQSQQQQPAIGRYTSPTRGYNSQAPMISPRS